MILSSLWRPDEGYCLHRHDPPQGEVIEKILRHCDLWPSSAPRAPPDVDGLVHDLDSCSSEAQMASSDQARELTYVDIDTFLATFSSSPTPVGTGTVRASRGINPCFAV
jgi:hypothetical protein